MRINRFILGFNQIELDDVFDISTSHGTRILTAAPDSRINIRSGPRLHFEVEHYGLANDGILIKSRTEVCETNSDKPCPEWSEVIFAKLYAEVYAEDMELQKLTEPSLKVTPIRNH